MTVLVPYIEKDFEQKLAKITKGIFFPPPAEAKPLFFVGFVGFCSNFLHSGLRVSNTKAEGRGVRHGHDLQDGVLAGIGMFYLL